MQTLALLFLEWLVTKLGTWFESRIGILCADIVVAVQAHRARVNLKKNAATLSTDVKNGATNATLSTDVVHSLNNDNG